MSRWYFLVVSKNLLRALVALFAFVLLFFLNRYFPLGFYTLSLLSNDQVYDIMLDAGHGGIDPGAIGRGELYEKHYVLDIVLKMRAMLTDYGFKVGLTRDEDHDVSHLAQNGTRHRRDLLGRYKLMNQARIGLSVHANATKDPQVAGALVFYLKGRYLDKIYAQFVFDELEKIQVMNVNHTVARDTLLLLKARPPVLLVEIGFMSNATDLAKITNEQFRNNVAHALCMGIIEFLEWREGEQSEP